MKLDILTSYSVIRLRMISMRGEGQINYHFIQKAKIKPQRQPKTNNPQAFGGIFHCFNTYFKNLINAIKQFATCICKMVIMITLASIVVNFAV